jgi:thymidylate synthase
MIVIEGGGINYVYKKACNLLTYHPEYETSPRGRKIRECTNVALILRNPNRRIVSLKERNLSLRYMAGEMAFYLAGSTEASFISHYSRFWDKIKDKNGQVESGYGRYLFHSRTPTNANQFDYCLNQLLKDKDSRKAVMVIYDINHSVDNSLDNPCTLSMQFLIRDNKIHMTVFMRSNDVWFGTPYDVAFFAFVQERLMVEYNKESKDKIEMGTYTHIAGSLHAYEKDWEAIRKVANSERDDVSGDERMPAISDEFENGIESFLFYERLKRENANTANVWFADPLLTWLSEKVAEEKHA